LSAEILRVHPDEPQPDRIDYIVACLRKGDMIALPTDTFYGLAVDPVNLQAVERIYQLKSRQKQKPLSLLISGLAQAYELARDTDPLLDKLADKFWPGPLTVIVRAGTKLPLRSTANTGNVALRVPDAAIARAVVERFGLPITATSANLQGVRVHARGVRPRPNRRPHPAHYRRRTDGPIPAYDHRGSLSRSRPLGDHSRGRHPHP
jgi:L-threonylcarbamoyladenylate synthase